MTTIDRRRGLRVGTIVPVWVLSALAAVVIGVTSPATEYFTWLAISLAAAVLLTFCIQLATLTKEGFVTRVMASIGGAVAVLVLATLVLGALAALNG